MGLGAALRGGGGDPEQGSPAARRSLQGVPEGTVAGNLLPTHFLPRNEFVCLDVLSPNSAKSNRASHRLEP